MAMKKIVSTIGFYVMACIFTLFFIVPLWSTIVGGFSTLPDVLSGKFRIVPREFSWNLPLLLQIQKHPTFSRLYLNTFLLSITAVPIIFFSAMGAFGLSRFRGPGQQVVFFAVMSTIMLPFTVTMIPKFAMFKAFGWINTYLPFYVPTICGSATAIFLLRQFMRNIPKEIDDAAKIDGAGPGRLFGSIIMPISKPALATTFIFTFVGNWNDFMTPLIFLTSTSKFPINLGILSLQAPSMMIIQWHCIMLAIFLAALPLLVIFFIFQRYIVAGVVMSGIKG